MPSAWPSYISFFTRVQFRFVCVAALAVATFTRSVDRGSSPRGRGPNVSKRFRREVRPTAHRVRANRYPLAHRTTLAGIEGSCVAVVAQLCAPRRGQLNDELPLHQHRENLTVHPQPGVRPEASSLGHVRVSEQIVRQNREGPLGVGTTADPHLI